MKEFSVSLPYFRVSLGTQEYLLDASFMESLKVPARRALLVFPAKDVSNCTAGRDVRPAYSSREAYDLLLGSLRWSSERRSEVISKSFKKYRFSFLLSLFMPLKWVQHEEDEAGATPSELVWATSILQKVLIEGGKAKPYRPQGVVRKCFEGYVEGGEVVFTSGYKDIVRNYGWLMKMDEGFKDQFIKTVVGL
ncbi:MAG: hypothetical protein J7L55_01810 [Desulfurococcales archaeon]|nr:hypothetical protein [Desulfurococcales archaeon]